MELGSERKGNAERRIQIQVCTGTNCAFRGATQLLDVIRSDESIPCRFTILRWGIPSIVVVPTWNYLSLDSEFD